jgi:hypothetical protein
MAVVELPFQSTSSIAVVTRYKTTHTAMPKGGTGHTDCVLPNGAPVGFFSTGLPISRGVVYGYALYASTRPHYIYAADARTASCISTILILNVGKKRCEQFLKAWLSMRAKTTSYSLFQIIARAMRRLLCMRPAFSAAPRYRAWILLENYTTRSSRMGWFPGFHRAAIWNSNPFNAESTRCC